MNTSLSSNFHKGLEIVLAHIIQDFIHFMRQQGLSSPQINALMYIYHNGQCQVSDIGVLAEASNAAASQLVERLVQQGFVERREDPINRRMKILSLTGRGKELIQKSIPSNHFLMNVMDDLTLDERMTIQTAFSILAQKALQLQISKKEKEINHA
jgi:DNA-binding MarR family transcriptional regulator